MTIKKEKRVAYGKNSHLPEKKRQALCGSHDKHTHN